MGATERRYDSQHNDIQHNDINKRASLPNYRNNCDRDHDVKLFPSCYWLIGSSVWPLIAHHSKGRLQALPSNIRQLRKLTDFGKHSSLLCY
jgi:hypothetical protein